MDYIKANTRASLTTAGGCNWLGFWLEMACCFLLLVAIILLLFLQRDSHPSSIALSLTYILNISIWFQWAVRVVVECNNMLISAERIDEYGHLPSEEDDAGHKAFLEPPSDWPKEGTIEFQHYSLRYRSTLGSALDDFNLQVASAEKLGIIGRTGRASL